MAHMMPVLSMYRAYHLQTFGRDLEKDMRSFMALVENVNPQTPRDVVLATYDWDDTIMKPEMPPLPNVPRCQKYGCNCVDPDKLVACTCGDVTCIDCLSAQGQDDGYMTCSYKERRKEEEEEAHRNAAFDRLIDTLVELKQTIDG